jgi:phosphoserine phosphatase RsbU/P
MKILLVEDDPVTLAVCEAFVRSLGHEPTTVEDGEKAWAAILSGRFQVVISDWSLPGRSGIDLCRGLRERKTADYPYFILITSYQGRERLQEAMEAGVDDFLTKPIDMPTLAIRLRVAARILDFHRQIGTLKELLPICMYCKKIRNDHAFWETVETYFAAHVGADFTHSLCPDCYSTKLLPELDQVRAENPPPGNG